MPRNPHRRVIATVAAASVLALVAGLAWDCAPGAGRGPTRDADSFGSGSPASPDVMTPEGRTRADSRARARPAPPASAEASEGRRDDGDRGAAPSATHAAKSRTERRTELLAYLRVMGAVTPAFDRIPDTAALGDLFADEAGLARLEASSWPATIPEGTVVALPSGIVHTDAASLRGYERLADVLVSGRGIDATLLILDAPIAVGSDVAGLAFEDLTVMCADDCFLELAGPALVRLRRCRVVGFDGGHMGSHLVRGHGVALLAEQCRFESGFGRRPGVATLLNTSPTWTGPDGRVVGYPSLAYFERCVFAGPFDGHAEHAKSFLDVPRAAAVVLSRCVLTDWSARDPAVGATARARLLECDISFAPEGTVARARALSELNPEWRSSDPASGR